MGFITIKHHLAPPFGRIVFGTFSKHLKQIKDLKLYRSDQIIATSHDLGPQKQDYVYIHICIYLEPICPLFLGLNPSKEGLFQSKQGSFGFQRTQMTHILEDLPHNMEGQPPKKRSNWV